MGPGIIGVLPLFLAACEDDRPPRDRGPTLSVSAPDPHAGLLFGPPPSACTADPGGERFERAWFPDPEIPAGTRNLVAGGLVVADLTGDGRLDVFLPTPGRPGFWVQDADRRFTDQVDTWFASDVPFDASVGGSVADYDADGDLDLYVTQLAKVDLLLRNEGDHFADVTLEAGISGAERSVSASWADYDGDGWLDLVVGGYEETDRTSLWRSKGDGTFEDRSDALPAEVHGAWTFMTAWHDLEGDGFPDLFVANDYFRIEPCHLLANRGGVFELDRTAGYHPDFFGMGLTLADLNDDGLPDLLESSYNMVSLLTSVPYEDAQQGVLWVSSGQAEGVVARPSEAGQVFGWGVDAGDLDNDGDHDLVATFGKWDSQGPNPGRQADSIWIRGEGERPYELEPWSDWGPTRAALLVDLDGDGALDLLKRTLDGDDPVDWGRCGQGHWLSVALSDPAGPNTHGIGATVQIEVDGRAQVRWVHSGSSSIFTGGPPVVHFGLGEAEEVDHLEVRWPDGRRSAYRDVPADRAVTVLAP